MCQKSLVKAEKEKIEASNISTFSYFIQRCRNAWRFSKSLNEKDFESGYFGKTIKVGDNVHNFLIEDDR